MSVSVNELIDQCRAQLDESNTIDITDSDILAALNRGQRKAFNIIVKNYQSMTWTSTTVTTTAGTATYDIPADAFGRRVEKVEIIINNVAYRVQRIDNHKKTEYVTSSQVTRPSYYAIIKNQIQLFPDPSGNLSVKIHYAKAPQQLVKSQGRITSVNTTDDFFLVDTLGDDISTSTDGFNSYIHVIDHNTGDIIESHQVAAIDTSLKKIEVKTAGLTRSTVLGNTIIATGVGSEPAADDYICIVTGTCVAELPTAYLDYIVQYGVVELRRRLGEPLQEEMAHLREMEEEITSMWAGREQSHRIRKASRVWGRGFGNSRRYFS